MIILLLVILAAVFSIANILAIQRMLDYLATYTVEQIYWNGQYQVSMNRLVTEATQVLYDEHETDSADIAEALNYLEQSLTKLRAIETSPQQQDVIGSGEAHRNLYQHREHLYATLTAYVSKITATSSTNGALSLHRKELDEIEQDIDALASESHTLVQRDIATASRSIQARMLGSMLGILVVFCLMILVIAATYIQVELKIVRPVKDIAQAAVAVTQGHLDQHVQITNNDEIGDLQTAFNTMVHSLAESHHNLEQQVSQRTNELQTALQDVDERSRLLAEARDEAEHARHAAESANSAKSAFLASMSHELRTPLNAILGFTQIMLRSKHLAPDHRDHLDIVRRSGEHLLTLINDVLDMSKIESGHTSYNETSFDLYRMLDDLQDMLKLRAADKGLQLVFDRTPQVPHYIRTDQMKLRQVLINLVTNGIKFTDNGGIGVRVQMVAESRTDSRANPVLPNAEDTDEDAHLSLLHTRSTRRGKSREIAKLTSLLMDDSSDTPEPHQTPDTPKAAHGAGSYQPSQGNAPVPAPSSAESSNRPRLSFEVEDTGAGITDEEIDTLFEAFVQTKTGQLSLEGTGLGLPISRKFVQLLGGNIQVRSILGKGTTFTFDIPIGIASADELEETSGYRQVASLAPGQPTYRILIADDKWNNRKVLLKMLEPFGFELREASNGAEAVDIWQAWHPHLIWMDVRMPQMNGYEATQAIKATTEGQATPIIAITASTLEEERTIARSAGCDDFMRKPLRDVDIFAMMERHLGVRYIYEDAAPNGSKATGQHTETTEAAFTPQGLATLPAEWVVRLHKAALVANVRQVEQVIMHIREHNSAMAAEIASLADDFRFDVIAQITGETKQG